MNTERIQREFQMDPSVPQRQRALHLVQNLKQQFPELTQEFSSLFSYYEQDESICLIGLGCEADIRADLKDNTLSLSLTINEEEAITVHASLESQCFHRYEKIFELTHRFIQQVKPILEASLGHKASTIPFLGGWKCVTGQSDTKSLIRFTLPKLMITLSSQSCCVSGTKSWVEPITAAMLTENLNSAMALYTRPEFKHYRATPTCREYIDNLVNTMEKMAQNCHKVVLGRKKELQYEQPINPLQLLHQIQKLDKKTYDIYMDWPEVGAWIGVSPETLVVKEGQYVRVEPLAGTRKGSDHQAQAEKYKRELIDSEKENIEHETASDLFFKALSDTCEPGSVIEKESKSILDLGYVQHLKSCIQGTTRPETSIFHILAKIYPPATIWGLPIRQSEALIENFEPFQREFFTGAFGFFNLEDTAHFSLAIRVAKIHGEQASVFAGSGIVQGADPYHEWMETDNKMAPFIKPSL